MLFYFKALWKEKIAIEVCMDEQIVVISFLFVLGTNGRMQPVVMAPKILSTKHYGLNKIKEKDNTAEENTREKQKKDPRET